MIIESLRWSDFVSSMLSARPLQVWEVGAQLLGLGGSIIVLKAIEVRAPL